MTNYLDTAGIVPIFSHTSAEVSLAVVRAAYAGGVRVFEYTNRNAQAFDNFRALISARPTEFPDMRLGIGTVFDPQTATMYLDAGAEFIVAPICNPAVGAICRERNVPWLPGCQTLTEVYNAHVAGASIVKVFPGEVVGPAFVRSVRSVLPAVKLMVTGGVEPTAESLGRWFGAGAMGVGMGSQLFPKEAIDTGNWAGISQLIGEALRISLSIRHMP